MAALGVCRCAQALALSLRQVGAALLLWSTARFSTPDHQEEEPPLTATGETPHAAMKTRAVANKPVERQRWGWSVKPTWIAGSNRKLADVWNGPSEPPEGTQPADTLISDSWLPELWENNIFLLSHHACGNLLLQLQKTKTDGSGHVLSQSQSCPAWACCSPVKGK